MVKVGLQDYLITNFDPDKQLKRQDAIEPPKTLTFAEQLADLKGKLQAELTEMEAKKEALTSDIQRVKKQLKDLNKVEG